MNKILALLGLLVALASFAAEAWSLGIPLTRLEEQWTCTDVDQVQITGLFLTVIPSIDEGSGEMVWTVDETFLLRNYNQNPVTIDLGIPNAWLDSEPDPTRGERDFWAAAYLNGTQVTTEVVRLVRNPAFPQIGYRQARRFQLTIEADRFVQVRLQFALPAPTTEVGQQLLSYPFQIGQLFHRSVEHGVVLVKWPEPMFGFRTNLPAYSLYRDRAEWFLRAFEPRAALEVRFLPRAQVFRMVGEQLRCPMPWEVTDRLSEGSMEAIREMLDPYDSERLAMCGALPATLLGSRSDALAGGLADLRLEQFAPGDSQISGPLFILNPAYDPVQMTDAEAVYSRVLAQELARRRGGP
ncbi:MAG: hypothetical protein JW797_12750 [Bradymonadales bacterium]|nr:hypothetical protein [Bradymonadales bacterium]